MNMCEWYGCTRPPLAGFRRCASHLAQLHRYVVQRNRPPARPPAVQLQLQLRRPARK